MYNWNQKQHNYRQNENKKSMLLKINHFGKYVDDFWFLPINGLNIQKKNVKKQPKHISLPCL